MASTTLARESRTVPSPQFNMRLDLRTQLLLEALGHRLNLNQAAVIRLAVARLALAEGVTERDAPSVQPRAEGAPDGGD
jgi:hypothetical protein